MNDFVTIYRPLRSIIYSVLRDHCHRRPPVLKDYIFLAESSTTPCNWTCHQRSSVLSPYFHGQWGDLSKTGSNGITATILYFFHTIFTIICTTYNYRFYFSIHLQHEKYYLCANFGTIIIIIAILLLLLIIIIVL